MTPKEKRCENDSSWFPLAKNQHGNGQETVARYAGVKLCRRGHHQHQAGHSRKESANQDPRVPGAVERFDSHRIRRLGEFTASTQPQPKAGLFYYNRPSNCHRNSNIVGQIYLLEENISNNRNHHLILEPPQYDTYLKS